MAIVINGSGTVTGISVGGLPDDIVDAGTLANDAVGLAQMAAGTDGNIITYDASGNPAVVASGTSGHFLKSQGADTVPVFAAVGGIDVDADSWFHAGPESATNTTVAAILDFSTTIMKTGSNVSESAGVVTVGTAGWYFISVSLTHQSDEDSINNVRLRKNGSSTGTGRMYWDHAGYAHPVKYIGKTQNYLLELAADDTLDIYGTGYFNGSAGVDDKMNSWLGFRLGA
jgi:hypothetical protein